MSTLHINLNLSNSETEYFMINRDNVLSDNIISTQELSEAENSIYKDFIELIGHNNVILTEVDLDTEVIIFNRMRLFEHDEKYNILNAGSYLKSYNEYSEVDKEIIDRFIILLNK